jgi:Domain of unknown function (DUF932)
MPANIFEDKVVTVRVPAWHRLGWVAPEPVTIAEAIDHVGGAPSIEKRRQNLDDGRPSRFWSICRIKDGAIEKEFASVSGDYVLVTHEDMAKAWEQGTDNALIDTFGILDQGKTSFITCPMPTADIKGDEVKGWLLLSNWCDGKTAEKMMHAKRRTVCMNTLLGNLASSASVFKVAHTGDVIANMVSWLKEAYGSALAKAEAINEAYRVLASFRPSEEQISNTLATAIPEPIRPQPTGATAHDRVRLEEWDKMSQRAGMDRIMIRVLYEGNGLGQDTPACAGTAFGLVNAVGEFGEYIQLSTNTAITARSFLFGERAGAVQRTFDTLLKFSLN